MTPRSFGTNSLGGFSGSRPTGQAPSGLVGSRFDPGRKTDPMCLTHRAWSPRYQSAPYRQHPGRREHIHGPIQPMDQPSKGMWFIYGAVLALVLIAWSVA